MNNQQKWKDAMSESAATVHFFKTFPFQIGQKIHIEDGPRHGDWLVVDVEATHITLQCPISKKQYRWPLFCYYAKTKENVVWPRPD